MHFSIPTSILDVHPVYHDQRTFYSAAEEKLNCSLKTDRRIFVVTEWRFYQMDVNFQMKKRPMDIRHVTGVLCPLKLTRALSFTAQ